ncbi:GGDEF domain-containing protein [Nitrosovibrio tenuis]|nr:GGDEF domain-containing protein [Nitrosovibrio tenuis]
MSMALSKILQEESLTPLYQPIVNLQSGKFVGYEGLIRGPSNSPLHSPTALFRLAKTHGLTIQLEGASRKVLLKQFAAQELKGKLFLNVSPDVLMMSHIDVTATSQAIKSSDVGPENLVIELTEADAVYDYTRLRDAAAEYRDLGLKLAIDDLGEGFSSLRLWSELRPEYVKIDMHFIQGIDLDPVKLQFVRSVLEIALESNSIVIAEGIETEAELMTVRDLGIHYGQGYFLGRPIASPLPALPPQILALFRNAPNTQYLRGNCCQKQAPTVRKIMREVAPVTSATSANDVYDLFLRQSDLQVIPVLEGGAPIGLVNRFRMIDRFARLYQRELYGKKCCVHFIDSQPLIVDHQTSLQDLRHLIVESDPQHLSNGFIITDAGQYVGIGTGHDLFCELTQMQMRAARYANPLTQLPGNVPINEHIDFLLSTGEDFVICYCDLDHFKSFNDLYGYRKGDEIIQVTVDVLKSHTDQDIDFIGHVGGDDFIVVFKSSDWETRCQQMLRSFTSATRRFYSDEHLALGGYMSENRQGSQSFTELVSMSLGVVQIDAAAALTSHQVAEAAACAKSEAKKMRGSSLFIERRQLIADTVEV